VSDDPEDGERLKTAIRRLGFQGYFHGDGTLWAKAGAPMLVSTFIGEKLRRGTRRWGLFVEVGENDATTERAFVRMRDTLQFRGHLNAMRQGSDGAPDFARMERTAAVVEAVRELLGASEMPGAEHVDIVGGAGVEQLRAALAALDAEGNADERETARRYGHDGAAFVDDE